MAQASRTYSRYAKDAVTLLGQSIREGRIARKITTTELAGRVGISRDLLYRIEHGDPACGIGSVFEAAAVTGVALFGADPGAIGPGTLAQRLERSEEKLALMPKSVRSSRKPVKDDF